MKHLVLTVILLAATCFGQPSATFPNSVATWTDLLYAKEGKAKLSATISDSTLTIPVTVGANFTANSSVLIGVEVIHVCSVSGNTLTACAGGRGYASTAKSAHTIGSDVINTITTAHHNNLAAEIRAIEVALGPNLANVEKPLTFIGLLVRDGNEVSCPTCGTGGGEGGAVSSVNTRTGDVVITATDVGLGNVNNTSDAGKPVSTAQAAAISLKANVNNPTFTGVVTSPSFVGPLTGNASTATTLQTPRTINGVSFNGSANITIADATKEPSFTTLSGAKGGLGANASAFTGLLRMVAGVASVVATGTSAQYLQGDWSLATFPTTMTPTAHTHPVADLTDYTAYTDAQVRTVMGGVTAQGVPVANGSSYALVILPDCANAITSKLLYNTATRQFSCGTDQGGGGGMTNPMTTLGDVIYGSAAGAATRLAGNTTTTRKFLRQTGNGANSASPVWDVLTTGDIPALPYQATITGAPGTWPTTFMPATHATAHQNGGADEIATATAAANAIPKAGAGGTLAIEWIPTLPYMSSGDGVNAGELKVYEAAAGGSEYRSWLAPDALTATLRFRFPNAVPAAGNIMSFGAPSGGISDVSFVALPAAESTSVSNSGASGANILKTGTNVTARRLTNGTGITITENADDISIAYTGSGAESTSPTNSGATGASVLKLGTNVVARKLIQGANMTITEGTDGITFDASGGGGSNTTNQNYRYITWNVDGNGSAITAVTGCKTVDFSGVINQLTVVSDVAGGATLDLKTVAHSSYTGPASTTSITNATPAVMSAAAALTRSEANMTSDGWNTTLASGTDMCLVVSSPSTITRLSVAVRVTAN